MKIPLTSLLLIIISILVIETLAIILPSWTKECGIQVPSRHPEFLHAQKSKEKVSTASSLKLKNNF